MLGLFHRIREEEEGQVLVLAVVAVFVLAMIVMTTVNIGHAVHEKIKLQNTADAVAYSVAARQARVFNFYAYTNRTQIVHYNSMLTFMAYLTYFLFFKSIITPLAWLVAAVPVVGAIVNIIRAVVDAIVKVLDVAAMVALYVLSAFNGLLFVAQALISFALLSALTDPQELEENDPDVKYNPPDTVIGGLARTGNLIVAGKSLDIMQMKKLFPGSEFDQVTNGDEGNEARAVMTELINNARHPWVAGSTNGWFLVGRRYGDEYCLPMWGLQLCLIAKKQARTEQGMMSGGSSAEKRDQIFSAEGLELGFKFGVSVLGVEASVKTTLHYETWAWADYKKGGHKIKPPYVEVEIKPDIPGISDAVESLMGRVTDEILQPILDAVGEIMTVIIGANCCKHFYYGVLPYFKFNPKASFRAGFNQPDVFVMVFKEDEKLRKMWSQRWRAPSDVSGSRIENPRSPDGTLDFEIKTRDSSDFDWIMPDGFAASSVARTYYHRPGEWKEHPNFFNPFWGAKLHPVAHHQLMDTAHFGTVLQLVVTH